MFFSAITKNLNLEFLSKNLVTFKRWDGVKDDKFRYLGGFTKSSIQGGRGLPKKVGLDSLQIEEGAWRKRVGGFFEGGRVDTQCTL